MANIRVLSNSDYHGNIRIHSRKLGGVKISAGWESGNMQEGGTGMKKALRKSYEKPVLTMHENLRDTTFECPEWQCSVVVPPPPPGP